jgi:hypothetical protein
MNGQQQETDMAQEIYEKIRAALESHPDTVSWTNVVWNRKYKCLMYECYPCDGEPGCHVDHSFSCATDHGVMSFVRHRECFDTLMRLGMLPARRTFLQRHQIVLAFPYRKIAESCTLHGMLASNPWGCCDDCLDSHRREERRLVYFLLLQTVFVRDVARNVILAAITC